MLTKKQIRNVSRLGGQTGGFDGFDESSHTPIPRYQTGRHTIKLNLVYVEMPNGDVVIQKK